MAGRSDSVPFRIAKRHTRYLPKPGLSRGLGPVRWRAPMKDAFDQWWEWANKPFSDMATIPAEIHQPVMALPPEDRHDRAKVNKAVRLHQRDRRSALGPAKGAD
jgi:hypothetical protein